MPRNRAAVCISHEISGDDRLENGPLGVFEFPQFANGTKTLGEAIAASDAFSIAGGGDTLAAIDSCDLTQRISYISTEEVRSLSFLKVRNCPLLRCWNLEQ